MATRQFAIGLIGLMALAIGGVAHTATAAQAPTPAQALALTPIQQLVEYTSPTKAEIEECTIKPEKENNVTSWVVRNRQGDILRRFADSNNDNVVDQWCYFANGIEVYRDNDSNFNGKADEYRWFNTAGTRWGVDKNEDGRIDNWRVISAQEVAEQVVLALKSRDPARFQLLMLTPDELNSLGMSPTQSQTVLAALKAAPAGFSKLMSEQKTVTAQSTYVDFGSARPGTVPAGTAGSTKDVTVCDNAAALVQASGKHDQVFLGTLVSVGDTWRLIDVPADNQNQVTGQFIAADPQAPGGVAENAPSEEMQKLMAELETLDKELGNLPADQVAANTEKRVATLQKLSEIAPPRDRDQWVRQLIDVLSVAITTGSYPEGVTHLDNLQKKLADANADPDVIAHAAFQRIYSEYVLGQRSDKPDPKVQEKWLEDLKTFVGQYPKSTDAAEALYQLGFYQEIFGKPEDAAQWYKQLVDAFPNARPAEKAKGALYRLGLVGKPLSLSGTNMMGGADVNLASREYRGKVVLIHYWSTMGDRYKAELPALGNIYNKRGGADFEIIGVCLDDDAAIAKQFVSQTKLPWKQIYEKGGLDGRLANQMGIMTLPLMIMVDQKGNVANLNVPVPEVESELAKLIKPAAAPTANALRPAPPAR